MATWAAEADRPQPSPRPRPRPRARPRAVPRPRRVVGGVFWIGVVAVLLPGVVALNVAVLRLNIRLDHLNNQSQQLQAQNAALGAKVSEAVSSPRIQALAKARGFVPADPATTGYVDLTPRRRR